MNKLAIITGATSGYGLATAKKLKAEGYFVVIASRNTEKVAKTVKEFGFDDGYVLDVCSYSEWEKFAKYIQVKYGKVDVLVNNAGGGVAIEPTIDQTEDNIDQTIRLNLNSVIYGCKLFGKIMKNKKDGVIINVSSVCATHCWENWSVYAAAKAGVLNFSKGLYVELQPYGVRVTCLIPASASTGFQKSAGLSETSDSLHVEDIANAVYYIVSQPKSVVVEEMTVWGTSQMVQPL